MPQTLGRQFGKTNSWWGKIKVIDLKMECFTVSKTSLMNNCWIEYVDF